jgi:hypothetical protein
MSTRGISFSDFKGQQVFKTTKFWDDPELGHQKIELAKDERICGVVGSTKAFYQGRNGYWRDLKFLILCKDGS